MARLKLEDMHGIPSALRRINDSQWIFGYLFLGAGALLVIAVAAYYSYGYWSKTTMDQLIFESARPISTVNFLTDSKEGLETVIAQVPVPDSEETIVSVSDRSFAISGALEQSHAVIDDEDESGPASRIDVEAAAVLTGASTYYTNASTSSAAKHSFQAMGDDSKPLILNETADGTDSSELPEARRVTELTKAEAVVPKSDGKSEQSDGSTGTASHIRVVEDALPIGTGKTESGSKKGLLNLGPGLSENDLRTFSPPTHDMLQLAGAAPSRIIIPVINVDSNVAALRLLSQNTGYEWETPKGIVGHIPTSGNPGIARQGWYFGHLESPLRREGNVFKRLPDIPALLKGGETVHIVVETDDGSYLYEVYKTDWVHEKDLTIKYSLDQDITLVTCYPTLVYDHRLLVTAALIGMSKS